MLGKLIKYDFKSMLRSFVPLWIAFLAVSIINRFTIRLPDAGTGAFASITMGISMFLYVAMMIAINVIGIILVIQRFYNGLLKDEGYLAFTLPVKPWQHVCSKGITATILIIVNGLISIVSVLILAVSKDFIEDFNRVMEMIGQNGLNAGLLISLAAVLILATTLKSIYQIYASMALGHLASKHRVAWSVGAYIGISVVLSIIGSVIMAIIAAADRGNWFTNPLGGFLRDMSPNAMTWMIFLILIAISLIQLFAFYIITERILAKRLNLE